MRRTNKKYLSTTSLYHELVQSNRFNGEQGGCFIAYRKYIDCWEHKFEHSTWEEKKNLYVTLI